jgi:hypothetical protein
MKKIAILLLLIIGLGYGSCKDYLDQVPQNEFTDASLFKTEADINAFLNTIYNMMLGHSLTDGWPNRGLDIFTVWSDDGYGLRDCCSGSDLLSMSTGGSKVLTNYWEAYVRIRQINEFLTYAPQAEASFSDPALYKRYIAEARFFRAYWYHKQNSFFGAIPLVLKPTGPEDYNLRNTRLSVFEWVDSELADVANDLPASYTGNDIGRITEGAVMALRGRHLLYGIDWHPDVASLYSRAETVLQDVYENSGYALVQGADNYDKLFTKAGAVTSENLWTKYYNSIEKGKDNLATGTSHGIPYLSLPPASGGNSGGGSARSAYGATSRLVEAYQMTNGLDIRDPNSGYDPANPWLNRDPRLEATILHAGEELPKKGASSLDNTYILNPHPKFGTTTSDDVTKNNVNKTGYYYQKYRVDFNWLGLGDAKLSDVQYHFIRFSEVILLYAEATLGNSGNVAKAMSLVNEVRARVGMPLATAGDADEALDKILYERRIELATEGDFRYYDIRRHRLGEEIFIGALPGGGDKSTVYGIPLGFNRVADAAVLEGDLDDYKKMLVGSRDFNATYFYAPEMPPNVGERNPLIFDDPVDFGPWVSYFDQE